MLFSVSFCLLLFLLLDFPFYRHFFAALTAIAVLFITVVGLLTALPILAILQSVRSHPIFFFYYFSSSHDIFLF